MATLRISINATGPTTATLSGSFTGGDSAYSYQRFIRVTIDGYDTFDVYSDEDGGGSNTFSDSITGLEAGTIYAWEATLYYRVTGGWTASTYTDSGEFETDEVSYHGRLLLYDSDGTTLLDGKICGGSEPTEEIDLADYEPSKTGYIFLGWATRAGSTRVAYEKDDIYEIELDTEYPGTIDYLYAVWQEVTPTYVSVQVSSDGESLYLYITPGSYIQGVTCYVEVDIFNFDESADAIQVVDLGRKTFGTSTVSFTLDAPTEAGTYDVGVMFTNASGLTLDSADTSFTIAETGTIWVYNGSTWVRATPYVYYGGWQKATPYIYYGDWNMSK